jgi:Chromate transporter
LGVGHTFSEIGVFFSKMAVVTFGGAYAVLAYMAQQAVQTYGWLRPGEMLDGLGMAETTPGPLIMVVQFVGFLAAFRHPGALPPMLAGTLGGLLATWCVSCFLWIGLGAPFIERLREPDTAKIAVVRLKVAGEHGYGKSPVNILCPRGSRQRRRCLSRIEKSQFLTDRDVTISARGGELDSSTDNNALI